MKSRITRLIMVAAIAALVGIAGSTVAWADELPPCPASPNYSPDFSNVSNNQACLTLTNGGEANDVGYPNFFSPASPSGTVNPALPAPANVSTVLRLTPNATFTSGSAWFTTQQPVAGPFSTTFTFQMSDANTSTTADGIAFVIQNSSVSALDPDTGGQDGCSIGYGDDPDNTGCTPNTGGIQNSLAIEFDPYQNADDPNNNHVAIQSCGTAANSSDNLVGGVLGNPAPCNLAINPLTAVISPITGLPITLADGSVHTATIIYTPSTLTSCGPVPSGPQTGGTNCSSIDVILDGADLFPGGVLVDLSTLLTLSPSNTAWVGFTAATGGSDDNQDILSWTFTPQAQTAVVSTTAPTVYPFLNGSGATAYDYTGQLHTGSPTAVTVTPILMTPAACNALVQLTYPGAQCFVYGNLSPNPDSAIMFELTCPGLTNSICNPLDAELGTIYTLSTESGVNMYNPALPFPGLLKGDGGVVGHPCSTALLNGAALFKSDQIDLFSASQFPDPGSHGSGGGTGSCWTATYNQPDQVPPGITITSPTNTSYAQGANVPASYTCSNPTSSKLPELPSSGNPVGPYLTAASCTQATGTQNFCTPPSLSPGGGISCTGTVPTSTLGPQTFTVTAMDSGTNTSTGSVNYTVVAPTDLAIANVALSKVATGSTLTYAIGVGNLGNANAVNVMVNDTLDPGTSFVSASGSNVACALVNKKVSCQTIPFPCVSAGPSGPVSCTVGPIYPLSISSLNGAVIKVVVNVTAAAGTTLKNTATVSAANLDPKPSNNSSTARTTVSAH